MSVEYQIKVKKGFTAKLDELLSSWVKSEEIRYQGLRYDFSTESRKYWIFAPGSVRGVTITIDDKLFNSSLNFRISAFAAEIEFKLCYSLMKKIAEQTKAKLLVEWGEELKAEELTEEKAAIKGQQEFEANLFLMEQLFVKGTEKQISLPVWDYDISLSRDEYLETGNSSQQLLSLLQSKSVRYADARKAGLMQFANGKTLFVYNFDNVITAGSDYVALNINENAPLDDYIFLPWNEFIQLFPHEYMYENNKIETYFIFSAKAESNEIEVKERAIELQQILRE